MSKDSPPPRAAGLLAAVLLVSCGAPRSPTITGPQPVAYADTLPIPEPEAREAPGRTRLLDAGLVEEMASAFSVRRWTGPRREALNVTAFDDVVSSAWWERRSGYRGLSPAGVARGPAGRGPEMSSGLTVVGPKTEGRAPGFWVQDGRGVRYLLKFDPAGYRHMSTAAEVIAGRLLWAAGYHTPYAQIVFVDSARLHVHPEARIRPDSGARRAMTRTDLHAVLARAAALPGGRYVAVASRVVPGEPKGPFFFEGRRSDDPNDYYPHQHRRELRALRVISAWINHREIRPDNTLDSYVPPGYLRHYLIDFGSALGSGTIRPLTPEDQRAQGVDPEPILGRLLTLGFYRPAWETETVSVIDPAIGWLPVEDFTPGEWRPEEPNAAFRKLTARDGYWAAKIVASFSDADLRAVVREGRLPRASVRDTLVEILAYRRDATVAHWYGRVSPLEDPVVRPRDGVPGVTLRFRDLGLRDGPWSAGETSYRWTLVDEASGRTWRGKSPARAGSATQQLTLGPPGGASRGEEGDSEAGRHGAPLGPSLTLRVRIRRGERGAPPARILCRWTGESGTYRVIGLRH